MDILFVTSELAPFSKVGGLADVCSALPKALRGLGHRVTVVSPLYPSIDPLGRSLARRLSKLEITVGGRSHSFELYDGRTAGGVDLLFLANDELFRSVPHIYGDGGAYDRDADRFGLFSHAALAYARAREPRFDVIHAHDWPTAVAVTIAKRDAVLGATPTVLTIHNLAYQGTFPKETIDRLGLPWELFTPDGLEFYGNVSLLKGGIIDADRITTVSPSYAREITTPEGGYGFDGVLSTRRDKLVGILNGIDTSVWNPLTDPCLASRFDPVDLTGKDRGKSALQQALELPVRADVPVIGAVGRFVHQKGFDLLADVASDLLRNDVQLVLLGEGDPSLGQRFQDISRRYPDRLQARLGHDEVLAHRIIAGADFLLVPSRFEPCGLVQMYAHRYGTLPIARKTGGLADTIVDCDAKLETGSGFLFDSESPAELLATAQRALGAFAMGKPFDALRRRVMRIDHSWERSARLYERLYRDVLPAAATTTAA